MPAPPDGIVEPLVHWFARVGRDLPWRRSRDPYRVWVSEIMLQQTQVERVKEFFTRFITAFPDVHALAAAGEPQVLKLWEGLGYYRRARQLHAAAKQLVAEHGGAFPRTANGLRSLPGVGRYTAAAIASIAFDAPEPIVEANSRRVLARLAGYDRPLDGARGDEPIWEIAAAAVPQHGAGRFNQALMDLGALVCTPDRPRCTDCPLASKCVAHKTRRTDAIPPKVPRRGTTLIREMAIVIRYGKRVLVEQRGPGEWWEGLWDFPRPGSSKGLRIGRVNYTVTHHAVECDVYEWFVSTATKVRAAQRWVAVADLDELAMSSPGRKIAAMLKPPPRSATLRRGSPRKLRKRKP
ncbi:MAG: A/G-specific adenine glycosylase [Planctomycetia bacterium]